MANKTDSRKNIIKKVTLSALFVLVFILGWILGGQEAKFGSIGFTPNLNKTNEQSSNVDFSVFWRAWDLIVEKYDGQLDYQNMVYGAIRGMTESLGDDYTSFLSPEDAQRLEQDLSGVIYGIGAEVGIKNDVLTIIAPIEDSPAKKAGLMPGDVITAIDGENTNNMNLDVAVYKIRGDEGTSVKLNILREDKELEFEIKREKITVSSVDSEILDKNIGYVEIRRFDENTTSSLRDALDNFIAHNTSKVILDLRDNPGGYLDESISVTSEFVKSGVVVTEKKDTESDTKYDYKSTGRGKMTSKDIKIIVLVNEGSASASEIVAGALQDYKRATIVGMTTFGKGSVQEIENLSRGAQIKITVAHWYTPYGRNITKEGIKPDIEVDLTEDDYNNDRDPQLLKAIELLK